jgi:hypothetical protein
MPEFLGVEFEKEWGMAGKLAGMNSVLNVCLTGGELPYIFIVHIDRQVSFSPL